MSEKPDQIPDQISETQKRKAGRPPGSKTKIKKPVQAAAGERRRHMHNVSIQERIREGCHPDLVFEYYKTILEGKTPIWVEESGMCYVIPDPNPLLPAPTLEQRNAAMKALVDRGYGLPSQSITVDAEFRNKVELQITGISTQQLETINLKNLAELAKMFRLPGPEEILDADLVDTNTNSPLLGSTSSEP